MGKLFEKLSQLTGVISLKIKRTEEKNQGVYVHDPELDDTEQGKKPWDIVEIRFLRDKNGFEPFVSPDYATDVLQTYYTGYCDHMGEERLGWLCLNDEKDGFDVSVDHYHICTRRVQDKSNVWGYQQFCKINGEDADAKYDHIHKCGHLDRGKIDFDQIKNPELRKKLLDKAIESANQFGWHKQRLLAKSLLIQLQKDEEEKLSTEILEYGNKVSSLRLKLAEKKKQRREAEADLRSDQGRKKKLSIEVARHEDRMNNI